MAEPEVTVGSTVKHLFIFGDYEIPMTYIAEGGYDTKPNQRQDLDPYTGQKGVTHRNALAHTKTEISITLRKNLTWEETEEVLHGLVSNYNRYSERDADCTYFDTENRMMKSGHLYLQSSQSIKITTVNKRYDQITLTFVEY